MFFRRLTKNRKKILSKAGTIGDLTRFWGVSFSSMSVFPQLWHFKYFSTVQVEMYDRVTESQLIVEISSSVTKVITCIFYSC